MGDDQSSDIVARMGGDEFCALLPRSGTEVEADLDRLRERLIGRGAFALPPLSLSAGVAISDSSQPTSIEQLIDLADTDMYSQKNLKKSRSSVGAS